MGTHFICPHIFYIMLIHVFLHCVIFQVVTFSMVCWQSERAFALPLDESIKTLTQQTIYHLNKKLNVSRIFKIARLFNCIIDL